MAFVDSKKDKATEVEEVVAEVVVEVAEPEQAAESVREERRNNARKVRGDRPVQRRIRDEEVEEQPRKSRTKGNETMKNPMDLMTRFAAPITSLSGSHLEKFAAPIKEFMENYHASFKENYGMDFEIFRIPSEVSRIRLESVIVTGTFGPVNDRETLAYTILLPASTHLGTQYTEGERGRNGMAYSAVASDAYNDAFCTNVNRAIANGRGDKGEIVHIGALTVPPIYDLSDKEKVAQLIIHAVTVVHYQHIGNSSEINDMALVDLLPQNDDDDRRGRGSDYALISNVVYKPEETVNFLGLPQSSDISVEISLGRDRGRGRDRDRGRNALSVEQNFVLGRLSANVDLVYIGEADDGGRRRGRNTFMRRRRQEDDVVPVYGIALNVTDIFTENRDVMSLQLATLANLPLLIKTEILETALLPTADETRLRDPRALLLEQPGEVDDLDISEHPDEREWSNLMEAICHEDSTFIFLHVPRTGIHSQLMTALINATSGDAELQDQAYDMINRVLNAATDNEWNEVGGPSIEIGELENRQSLNGYWTGPNGERLSLNGIGRFNMLTRYGKDHPEYLENYDAAIDGVDDLDVSNAHMEELLMAYTSKSAQLIDRNDVIRLNPEWLAAMAEAYRASGVTIDAEGISTENGRRRQMSDKFATGSLDTGLYRTRGRGRNRR